MPGKFVYHGEHFFAYPQSHLSFKNYSAKDFGKVAVLLGGTSGEREVSLESGKGIVEALSTNQVDFEVIDAKGNYLQQLIDGGFDRAFIILHGKQGEDGCVQGALDSIGLPYTGSGVAASALAMDKPRSKMVMNTLGLPTPRFGIAYTLSQADELSAEFGFPVVIKPVSEGSSLGTARVEQASEVKQAFEDARQYGPVLIEPWVIGTDIFVSVLGDEVLPSVQVEVSDTFYDYEAKYKSNDTRYLCPAPISESQELEVRKLAKQAFYALGCEGWGRVDLIKGKDGKFWILEVNTIPGMTSHSLVPMSAKAVGLAYDQLVMQILATTMPEQQSSQDQTAQVVNT